MKYLKSPNFTVREYKVNSIVLHYTEVNLNETLKIFTDPKSELSSHYIITEEGEVVQMVDDDNIAWHAGRSFWRGMEDLNRYSIGIEIVNDGKSCYPDKQIQGLINLLDRLRSKFTIDDINIVGHSDIAPLRKSDPGKLFPWNSLAAKNHGIFVSYDELKNNQSSYQNSNIKNDLIKLGYGAKYCEDESDFSLVVTAFLNHFASGFTAILPEREIVELINMILAEI